MFNLNEYPCLALLLSIVVFQIRRRQKNEVERVGKAQRTGALL